MTDQNGMTTHAGNPRHARQRRLLLASTALSAALLAGAQAHANPPALPANTTPQGGQVVGGQARITQAPGDLTITQSSARTAINWQSFNVGSAAKVTFEQPNAQAIALNRVISNNPSIIAGRIDANGQIVLMNQSGVVFTPGSQVNAESLVVSTAGISAKNFMAGHMIFDAPPKPGARIVNDGTITMKQAGLAAFVAPQVINRGTITATLGHVILAGASTFTLDIAGDGLVSIDVTQAVRKIDLGGRTVDALVTNHGIIVANGGTVTLTAQAVDGVIQQLLDVRGTVQADSVGQSKGGITIAGIGGDLQVAGNLLARGTQPGSGGGTIAVDATGAVQIASTARIDASGMAGGGMVAIGTDAARAAAGPTDTAAPKAHSVSIAHGAVITADATQSGTGGTITVLSAKRTDQHGALSAQGIDAGGRIETSSDGVISLSGTETVFSAHGHDGTILLDPATLIVAANTPAAGSTVSGGATTIGTDNSNTSYIDPSVLASLTGTVVLTASSLLSVQSAINMSDADPVTLASGKDLIISNAVQVGGSLEIDAAGSLVIGGSVNAANITLLDSGTHHDIAIGDVITAGTLLAMLAGGNISETSNGYVVAPTLTSGGGTIGGDVLLANAPPLPGSANNIGTLGAFAATGTLAIANVQLLSASPLVVDGPVNVKAASLTAGGITIAGPISVTSLLSLTSNDALDLYSKGTITQTEAGVITAGTLSGAAGGVALNIAPNAIGVLQNFNASGSIALDDSASALTINGGISTANATIDANGITIAAPLTITPGLGFGALTLGSTGGIEEIGDGAITAGLLASDGTITGGAVNLSGSNNIDELGGFTASGALQLNDATTQLTIAGQLQAASATLESSKLYIDQPISVSGVLALAANAGIDQASQGTITAGTLTSGGITIGGVNLSLDGTTNTIATLGAFATSDNFSLNDNGSPLTIAGPFTAPAASITAPDILFSGPATIAGQLALASTGSITEAGTATLAAGTLTSLDNTIGGDVLLGSTLNQIGTLAAFGAGGSFELADTAPLTVTGPVTASGITLIDANGLTLAGALAVGTSQTINLVASAITDAGATLEAPSGTIALAPYTPDTPLDFGGTTAGGLMIAPSLASAIAAAGAQDIVLGSVSLPGATYVANTVLTEGALPDFTNTLIIDGLNTITNTADLQGFELTLAGGAIVNTGTLDAAILALTGTGFSGTGLVVAPALSGSFSQAATFGNTSNAIGLITGLTAGSLLLTDGATPTIGGTIAVASGGDLTVAANQIAISAGGAFSAPNGTIGFDPLTGGTPISLGGTATGTLDIGASLLAAISPGAAVLDIGNALSGPLDVAVSLSLAIPNIVLHGNGIAVNASLAVAGTVDLESTGTISQTAPITATTLIGSANGAVLLQEANSIGTLGRFTDASGPFDLTDSGTLVVTGPLSAANVALIAGDLAVPGAISTGSLALTATNDISGTGTITANTMTGSAAALSLTGPNQIGTLGALSVTGEAIFNDAAPLTIAGPVSAGILALGGTGPITEPGSIKAATLASYGTIGGDVALTGINAIATLGSFAAAASVSLNDTGTLNIAGPLTANTVTFTAGGLTETGSIFATSVAAITTGSLALTGTNTIATIGNISAQGNATIVDGVSVTLDGTLIAPNATITAPNISLAGSIATGLLSLASTGDITGTGPISTTTLTGSAGTLVSLTGANTITTLGAFTGTGSMAFNDTTALHITGPVTAPDTLSFADTAPITEPGSINAGTLASFGGGVTNAQFTGTNTIATLGDFSATGLLSVADQTDLAIAGAVHAATVTLTTPGSITETGSLDTSQLDGRAGAMALTSTNTIATLGSLSIANTLLINDTAPLTIAGTVTAGTLGLGDSGAITETGGITAATLISLGTIGGMVGLTGNNTIAALGAFATGQNFTLDDTAPLTITGPLTAANATLATGALAVPGAITTGTLAFLSSGAITATGPLDVATLLGHVAGTLALTGTNQIATIASLSAGGNAIIDDASSLILTGPLTAPDATINAAAIAIPGNIATPGTLVLGSTGPITETGTITAQTLASDQIIGGNVALSGTNTIVTLSDFAARHDVLIADSAPLTVAGTLSAANATLSAAGLSIPGDIAVPGTVSLASTGSIGETGTINTARLIGSSTGPTNLTGTNGIATLGVFTVTDGSFIMNDTSPLVVTGPLTAANISLTTPNLSIPGQINTPGTITLGGGRVTETGNIAAHLLQTAGTLSGDANLSGTNEIARLGDFNDFGHYFSLNDANSLTITGPVTARAVTITADDQLVLDGTAGGGLFIQGQNLATPIGAGVQPRPGIDSVLSVRNGGAQQLLQTGIFNIDTGPIAQAEGLANQPNSLFLLLPSTGSAIFANLAAPNTTLVINLGGGSTSGQVDLHYLVVAGSAAGQANFNGSLGNLFGQAAAHNGIVVPVPGSNYRFNACIIGSVNCTVLPVLVLPEASPLLDFDLSPTRRRRLDPNVRLPGVAAKDY